MVAQKTTTNCWHTSFSRTPRPRRQIVHFCFYHSSSILSTSSYQGFLDSESELWMDHSPSYCLSWTRFPHQNFLEELPHGTQPYSSTPTRYPPHISWTKTWNVHDPYTILTFPTSQPWNHHKRIKARLYWLSLPKNRAGKNLTDVLFAEKRIFCKICQSLHHHHMNSLYHPLLNICHFPLNLSIFLNHFLYH